MGKGFCECWSLGAVDYSRWDREAACQQSISIYSLLLFLLKAFQKRKYELLKNYDHFWSNYCWSKHSFWEFILFFILYHFLWSPKTLSLCPQKISCLWVMLYSAVIDLSVSPNVTNQICPHSYAYNPLIYVPNQHIAYEDYPLDIPHSVAGSS